MGELSREALTLLETLSHELTRALVCGYPLRRLGRLRDNALRRYHRRLRRTI